MTKFLTAFLLLLAPVALAADAPQREVFPDDYVRQSCAPKNICTSLRPLEFGQIAKVRGFELRNEWVLAHWDQMLTLLNPACEKVANCLTMPGNDWVWCKDVAYDDFVKSCASFDDPDDAKRCGYFATVFFLGQDVPTHRAFDEAQKCGIEQAAAAPQKEKTFEYWMLPAKLPIGYNGKIMIHAIDSETRIPLMVHLNVDGPNPLYPTDTVDGKPLAGYAQRYKFTLKRVARPDGHFDVEIPVVTLTMPGYRTEQFTIPTDRSEMILSMSPKSLKRGKNTVTITATDATTGKPVEARVMGDDHVLGKTNKPFEVEWKKGEASPEIWVTSLYDLYDDAVMFPKTTK